MDFLSLLGCEEEDGNFARTGVTQDRDSLLSLRGGFQTPECLKPQMTLNYIHAKLFPRHIAIVKPNINQTQKETIANNKLKLLH